MFILPIRCCVLLNMMVLVELHTFAEELQAK